MKIRAERETIIVINLEDSDNGYFVVYTTEKGMFNKVCKKVGGEDKLRYCKKSKDSYECGVPIDLWNGIKFLAPRNKKKRKTYEVSNTGVVVQANA
jgi:hypothetical protein